MELNSLFSADVSLSNYSLTHFQLTPVIIHLQIQSIHPYKCRRKYMLKVYSRN